MNALCHPCERGTVGTLPVPLATSGDPLACCQICSVFSCGHHGQRDPAKPRFVCVQCDPTLLKQSAVGSANDPDEAPEFRSVQEFRERRPRYGAIPDEVSKYTLDAGGEWRDPQLGVLVQNLSQRAKELLILAGILVQRFLSQDAELPPDLQDLRDHVRRKQPWE